MGRIAVKVVPGAASSVVVGWLGESLKLKVAAPPEKGKANAAVTALLAEALNVPGSAVRIASGHGSPRKQVEVDDVSTAEIRRRLGGDDSPRAG
jgi:uncharacterized protein (TIGR00251 family)